jgi:branched-chain amino acid transport system ATP-binding protein
LRAHAAYGLSRVSFGISLEVNAGECVCLLGPQWCRKDHHDAFGDGADAAEFRQRLLQVSRYYRLVALPSGTGRRRLRTGRSRIFAEFSVWGNLDVARRAAARPGRWAIESVTERFPVLGELRDRQGGFLSGGDQQMLTIARTLMGNPELLLLDEPSEALAPLVVEALLAKIGELKAQGLTILLAEQSIEFSLALADRVYVLEKGALRFTGSSATLRSDRSAPDQLLRQSWSLYQRVPIAERKSPAAMLVATMPAEARSMNMMSLELVASSRV